MDRSEIVLRLVLDEICDDYENVDQIIFPNVSRRCAKLGMTIGRSAVVEALRSLVDDGLAKAYILTPSPNVIQISGMPNLDIVEEDFQTYFLVTKLGREVQDTYVGFPFDALGEE